MSQNITIEGRYKLFVLNPDGSVAETREQKNLILNNGLNNLFKDDGAGGHSIAAASRYCHIGQGNTPFVYDSGTTTASCSSTIIDQSTSFFSPQMVGMLINFDTGEQATITQFNQSTQVVINKSLNVTNQLFAVYAVGRNALQQQVKTTNSYLTGGIYCGRYDYPSNATSVYRRTYEFSTEQQNINYSELGWQFNGNATNLFSGTLINGGTVSVLAGQRVRVQYEIIIGLAPYTPIATQLPFDRWPIAPATNTNITYMVCNYTIQFLNSSGSDSEATYLQLEPRKTFQLQHIQTPVTVWPLFQDYHQDQQTMNNTKVSVNDSYVIDQFERTSYIVFQTSELNMTTIRTFKEKGWNGNYIGLMFSFEQNQTKTVDDTVFIYFKKSITRKLTNI